MDYIDEMTEATPPELSDEIVETPDELINASDDVPDTPEEEPTIEDDGTESKIVELQAELDKANARMSDKDKYINELRNQKPKEEAVVEQAQETDFWEDPEAVVKSQDSKIEALQFQLAEQSYARNKPDYYDVANMADLQAAMAKDAEFANEFNSSDNKFDTAYTYLKKQSEEVVSSEASLREQIKEELMAELNIKPKKEIPKTVSSAGNSNGSKSEASEDGFADIFGSSY